jgi:hypothetical protein
MAFLPSVEVISEPASLMSCRAAMTGNSDLSTLTADGITLVPGDRVLCRVQTTTLDSGIYTVPSSGTWGRSYDMQYEAAIPNGMMVFVREGATYGNHIFVIKSTVTGPTMVVAFDPMVFLSVTVT